MTNKAYFEVVELMDNWSHDPCWDIENTKGFEEWKPQLLEYRLTKEKEWSDEYDKRISNTAVELDCSYALAKYILLLRKHITDLEEKIDKIEYGGA